MDCARSQTLSPADDHMEHDRSRYAYAMRTSFTGSRARVPAPVRWASNTPCKLPAPKPWRPFAGVIQIKHRRPILEHGFVNICRRVSPSDNASTKDPEPFQLATGSSIARGDSAIRLVSRSWRMSQEFHAAVAKRPSRSDEDDIVHDLLWRREQQRAMTRIFIRAVE